MGPDVVWASDAIEWAGQRRGLFGEDRVDPGRAERWEHAAAGQHGNRPQWRW